MAAAMGFVIAGTFAVGAQSAEMPGITIVDGTIAKSLTGVPGNAANGKKVAINRKKGNCLACHEMPIPEQQFHGKTGPDLNGVAQRYDAEQLRLRLVDAQAVTPDTMMPSFYKTGQHDVAKKFVGKTILSAQEVEDVIAYLMTIK
jgi:sulfur-oxidizing protein SoxX